MGVRAIDDWMEWSGRRPPKASVLAAIRILSGRGRGDEVLSLVARCTLDGGMALVSYPNTDEIYEMVLYVDVILALRNEGLYDDVDDAFIAAVNGKFLPFDLKSLVREDGKQHIVLDLHGMNDPREKFSSSAEVLSTDQSRLQKKSPTQLKTPCALCLHSIV
jgi:hypothetical protein